MCKIAVSLVIVRLVWSVVAGAAEEHLAFVDSFA